MLDPGCVLRLVDAEVAISVPERLPHLRGFAENGVRIDHLVVVIHKVLLPKPGIIAPIDLCEADPRQLVDRSDLLLPQHHVLAVRDLCPQRAKIPLAGPLSFCLLIEARQNTGRRRLLRHELKRFPSDQPAVIGDDLRADAVDRAELQSIRHLLAKKSRKPPLHIARCRHCICYGQNILRRHAAPEDQVTQPRHEDCRLPASGHCQQQHRPVHGEYGLPLLVIEFQRKAAEKIFSSHTVSRVCHVVHFRTGDTSSPLILW